MVTNHSLEVSQLCNGPLKAGTLFGAKLWASVWATQYMQTRPVSFSLPPLALLCLPMANFRTSRRVSKPSARARAASNMPPSPATSVKTTSECDSTIVISDDDSLPAPSRKNRCHTSSTKSTASETECDDDLVDNDFDERKELECGNEEESEETENDKAEPKPVEITVNISLFWSKEFAKDAKKRSATASGIMTSQSNDSYRKFEHSFLAKVAHLAQLYKFSFKFLAMSKKFVELFDDDDYKTMVRNATKCKDPTVTIAVTVAQEDSSKKAVSDEEVGVKKKGSTQQQPSLGVERESVTARIAHDRASRRMWPTRPASIGGEQSMRKNPKILQREYCNYAPDPRGWGCVPRTREEEPDSGVLQTGVPTGSKTEGCLKGTSGEPVSVQPCQGTSVVISSPWSISQGKRQRVGVLVLPSERGVKARPEQQDEDKSTPGSSPRTKQSSQSRA
ncbi:hypothetical protein DFH08DRAFT_806195 [Mycena albidolilacea]|uniref:Uncharacterized protein n=1 Tax=Mycena albidolilacea TaxID=1033008 RepID=A0AAD7A7Z0_9AGAR|nr:hypothetical protein DFH08DRAFT_806195 [Mycena albidolilacea]